MSDFRNIPIGVQLWSVKDKCENDFPGTLRTIKAMGYEGVEFAGFYGRAAAEVKALIEDIGLKIAGAHVGLQLLDDDTIDQTIAYHQELGNDYLIVPSPGGQTDETLASWEKLTEKMKAIQTKVEAAGLRFGYHNHAGEFDRIEGSTPFDTIFGDTSDEFIMQVDIGWAFRAGADAREVFKKYPARSRSVHCKAFSAENPKAAIGEDDIPWADVLQVAVDVAKTEWFVVEDERRESDSFENIKADLDHLKSL